MLFSWNPVSESPFLVQLNAVRDGVRFALQRQICKPVYLPPLKDLGALGEVEVPPTSAVLTGQDGGLNRSAANLRI